MSLLCIWKEGCQVFFLLFFFYFIFCCKLKFCYLQVSRENQQGSFLVFWELVKLSHTLGTSETSCSLSLKLKSLYSAAMDSVALDCLKYFLQVYWPQSQFGRILLVPAPRTVTIWCKCPINMHFPISLF